MLTAKDGRIPVFSGFTSVQWEEVAMHHLFLLHIHGKNTETMCMYCSGEGLPTFTSMRTYKS